MHTHPEAGRNDNIHGDEYREHLGAEKVDLFDVLFAIEAETGTHDGMHYYHWCQRIAECDEFVEIIKRIVKNRHNPAYAELINDVESAIEGWL